MTGTALQTPNSAVTRHELLWLAAAIVFGAILRLGYPSHIAIEHFDEGVYASNIWFGDEMGYEYPARYLYAPPFLPAMIEWTIILASLAGMKPTGWVPVVPCLVIGIAMIPSIWWVGRRWFGPTTGIIAAWFVATSDFHASYSRAALTDVPVAFLILWSVYFVWRAIQGRNLIQSLGHGEFRTTLDARGPGLNWINILVAAIATGLAWWTKYNGWLPLAIGLAGGSLWQALLPRAERQILSVVIRWLLIAGLTWLIWMPVVVGLQDRGGYASVGANHRQYLVGLAGWFSSAHSQLWHIGIYDNWFAWLFETMLGPAARDVAAVLVPILFELLAGAAIVCGLRQFRSGSTQLAICLLLAWYCGMTVSTPFYYPYPRLVFPWLTAIWLALGLGVQLLRDRSVARTNDDPGRAANRWNPSVWEWGLVAVIVINAGIRSLAGTSHAWQDRTSLAVTAEKITSEIRQQVGEKGREIDGAIVYVWGEPSLFFGLRAGGITNVLPVANLGFVGDREPIPVFLVFGKQSHDSSAFAEQKRAVDRCRLLKTYEVHTSHLVTMDSRIGSDAMSAEATSANVWLYRVP